MAEDEIRARRIVLEEEDREASVELSSRGKGISLIMYEAGTRVRRAGRPVDHSNSLKRIIPRWFGHRFGKGNSLTGVPGSHPGSGKDRTLAERDPLARARRTQERSA